MDQKSPILPRIEGQSPSWIKGQSPSLDRREIPFPGSKDFSCIFTFRFVYFLLMVFLFTTNIKSKDHKKIRFQSFFIKINFVNQLLITLTFFSQKNKTKQTKRFLFLRIQTSLLIRLRIYLLSHFFHLIVTASQFVIVTRTLLFAFL